VSLRRIAPRRRSLKLVVGAASALLLWLVAWIAAKLLIVSVPLNRADAIVVLSGSSTYVERTHLAAQLYNSHKSDRIILTNDNLQGGWLSSQQRNPYFYERARWELERLGVPEASIEIATTPVDGTDQEALVVRDFVVTRNIRSILLVTSGYHSRRALWTFHQVLSPSNVVVGMQAAPPGWQTPKPQIWFFSLRGWQLVPTEYLKIMYYRLRGLR
jgi:uncharacterized SAM-binding protein YcdF (DUF218 family)